MNNVEPFITYKHYIHIKPLPPKVKAQSSKHTPPLRQLLILPRRPRLPILHLIIRRYAPGPNSHRGSETLHRTSRPKFRRRRTLSHTESTFDRFGYLGEEAVNTFDFSWWSFVYRFVGMGMHVYVRLAVAMATEEMGFLAGLHV